MAIRTNSRSAAWCFTSNNPTVFYTPAELGTIRDLIYCVYQQEVGAEGTPHLQGYMKFRVRKRFSMVSALFLPDHPHVEPAKGSSKQNHNYCTKAETRAPNTEPVVYGELPEGDGSGSRNDLTNLRDAIKNQQTFRELTDNDELLPVVARHMPFVTRLLQENLRPPQRPDVYVRFCYGAAGCGKSTCAGVFEDNGAYLFDNELRGFWDGYTDQKIVIMDEFRGHTLTPTQFNRLCDKGPMQVNIKNGSAPMCATDIRFTSNYLPSTWWSEKTAYNREALYRRVDEAHLHRLNEEPEIFFSDRDKVYHDCAMVKLEERLQELAFVSSD